MGSSALYLRGVSLSTEPVPKTAGSSRRRRSGGRRSSGQSLVEFALVVPVLLMMLGGVVQLGVIFAAKNSLVQVARDTARWAATQNYSPCNTAATATPKQPLTQADATAVDSGLIGYASGTWTTANFTAYADNTALPASPPNGEGIEVVWSYTPSAGPCPTTDNTVLAYVTIRLTHAVPIFLPGLWLITGGTCDASGCNLTTSSSAMFRMEPPPP
jgi:Flp pilus assembly protein TadG